jgi:KDO2-lipid IV(A) lauroyltransferase
MTPSRDISLRHRVEWTVLRGLLGWLRRGTIRQASRRTRNVAFFARWILRRDWRWCVRNLELVFGPSPGPDVLRRLGKRAFEELFVSYMEGVRWRDVQVTVEGEEHLHGAVASGRGVVGCGIHMGSWEPALEAVTRLAPGGACVYRPVENPLSEREFFSIRSARQTRWIPKDDMSSMLGCLGEGRLLILFIDLNAAHGGVEVPYLGVPAMSPSGPARLALRFGCPVVPMIPRRTADGEGVMHIGEPLDPAPSRAADAPLRHLTRRIHEALEPWIIRYAEQYNWTHPRWRTRPTGPAWTLCDPVEGWWAARVAPFAELPPRVRSICGNRLP